MKNTNDMTGSINIIDDEYSLWVKQLGSRYRQSRISAACQVNGTLIEYYWNLGRDITSKDAENRYGSRFYSRLSADLRSELPGVEGLSETNIRYAKRFYPTLQRMRSEQRIAYVVLRGKCRYRQSEIDRLLEDSTVTGDAATPEQMKRNHTLRTGGRPKGRRT